MKYNFSQEISDYFAKLQNVMNNIDIESVNVLMNVLIQALEQKKQIFI